MRREIRRKYLIRRKKLSKTFKTVLLALLVSCLCLALVIAASYALFSESVTVNNHLVAGSLKVGLTRTDYKKYTLVDSGEFALVTDGTDVNLGNTDSQDFMLFEDLAAVPQSWSEVTLLISNGGDVAFDYGIRLLTEGTLTGASASLAQQIQVEVISGETSVKTFMLSEQPGDIALGSILAGAAAQTITVRATFVDEDTSENDGVTDNNSAQGGTVSFDVQVYAVQKTV